MKKVKTISPVDIGYVSSEKENYRNSLYNSLHNYLIDEINNNENCYAIIMPSKEGLEIKTAINRGIKENKIICVDNNPALIATSKWRKEHPACKFYGCKVSELPQKLEKNNQVVSFANLDLCNNFSEDLIYEVIEFLNCHKSENFTMSITIAKGRENKATCALFDYVNDNGVVCKIEDRRAKALLNIILKESKFNPQALSIVSQGSYIHSKMPMTWVCVSNFSNYEIEKIKDLTDKAYKAFNSFADFVLKTHYGIRRNVTKEIKTEHNRLYNEFFDLFKKVDKFHNEKEDEISKKSILKEFNPLFIYQNLLKKHYDMHYYLFRKRDSMAHEL